MVPFCAGSGIVALGASDQEIDRGVERVVTLQLHGGRLRRCGQIMSAGFQRHGGGDEQHMMIVMGPFNRKAPEHSRQRKQVSEILRGLSHQQKSSGGVGGRGFGVDYLPVW